MDPEHAKRVLEHQLFNCPLEELFKIYQGSKEDPDSTYLGMVYAIGRWRFGPQAWGDHHTEYFKERARNNAELGITTSGGGEAPRRISKREMGSPKLSLADLGL